MSFYKINAGTRALDQGCKAPLSTLFSLAEVLNTGVLSGVTYGDDYIAVPESPEDKAIAEELLNEPKLIWEIVPTLPYYLAGYA